MTEIVVQLSGLLTSSAHRHIKQPTTNCAAIRGGGFKYNKYLFVFFFFSATIYLFPVTVLCTPQNLFQQSLPNLT